MSRIWTRRAALALAGAAALILAACGSGSIESQLNPTRILVFGTGFSDMGQTGATSTTIGKRYTVNDGGNDIWIQDVATSFGLTLAAAVSGGTDYATGNARITAKPDAAGNSATPTVTEQVNNFLAAGGTFNATDLVVIEAGVSDIIAETMNITTNGGTQSSDQALANVKQEGRDLGAQVRRLVQAGAQHVVVVGTYDLSRTPWSHSTGQDALLTNLSTAFNTAMLVSIVDLGANVLYIDAAFEINLIANVPTAYNFIDSSTPVCSAAATDPGPGIGIGTGKLNSALCTPTTIIAGATYVQYVFADQVYITPQAHSVLASYAYDRIRSRW